MEIYLDDCIAVIPDIGNNRARGNSAMTLAIHAVSQKLAQKEPLPRDKMIKPKKAKSEGALEDINIFLGWVYITHILCVSFTKTKSIDQKKTIQDIWLKDEPKSNNLLTLIGRLNHTASIIPLARHFLTIIRFFKSNLNAFTWYLLRTNICDDLKLHMRILQKSRKCISMNLLTYHEPTRIYLIDACEIGMGGFISKGRAWRWKIFKEYWGRAHINLLEFCVELVSIWIDII